MSSSETSESDLDSAPTKKGGAMQVSGGPPNFILASGILSKQFEIPKWVQLARGLRIFLLDEGFLKLTKEGGLSLSESMRKAAIEEFQKEVGEDPVNVVCDLLDIINSFVESDKRMKPNTKQMDALRDKARLLSGLLSKIEKKGK